MASSGFSWAAEVEKHEQQESPQPQKHQKQLWSAAEAIKVELPTIPETFNVDEYEVPEPVIIKNENNNTFIKYSWKIECDPKADASVENPPMVLVQYIENLKSNIQRVNKAVANRRKFAKFGMAKDDGDGPNGETVLVSTDDIPIIYSNRKQISHNQVITLTETEEQELNDLKRTVASQLKMHKLCGPNMGQSRVAASGDAKTVGPTGAPSFFQRVKDSNPGSGPSDSTGRGTDLPVRPGRQPNYQEEGCGVRITNLSENIIEGDINDLFGKCGRIKRVFLARDKKTNRAKGFAYVTYERKSEAEKAIRMLDKYAYDHLILSVEWSKTDKDK